MSFQFDACTIIGHRGAAGLAPENTLPSFRAALAHNVDAVELDVYCVENTLVVIHDDTLDRTTNRTGRVNQCTLANLREADAGGGAMIPTLDEVWAVLPRTVGLNVELKGPNTGAPVAAWLAQREVGAARVMVSSFDHAELQHFSSLSQTDEIIVAPLLHRWRADWEEIVQRFDTSWINLNQKILTQRRMEALLRADMTVSAYTVNTVRRANTLLRWGVKGLFTDRPDRVSRSVLAG